MKITSDYHVHCNFSGDSTATMESMIEQGIALHLKQICFTDHMDYEYPKQYLDQGCRFEFNVEEYFDKIEKMNQRYGSEIEILAGIELGVKPELAERLNQLVSQYPFDFVIASSHLLDNYDPYYNDYWEHIQNQSQTGVKRYFQSICENIEAFSNFDVYGHLDYIVRYVPEQNFLYRPSDYQEEIDRLLQTLIRLGKGIEINTAGLKYGLPFAHPKEEIIKRYIQLGGTRITIGSDAHKPEHLAYDFAYEAEQLQALGIQEYTIFKQRTPILCPLN